MITLKKLQWNNFFSYGENNEILLNEHNITQLIGKNGVGKSSIALILEEVLFNKNSKNIKKADIVNRNKNGICSAELWFDIDSDVYKLSVSRKATSKITLLKNGKDISSHTATQTYKQLQEILGIDFKLFSQIIYQSTASSLEFLTATDATRKAFFVDLLGLDEFIQYYNDAKNLDSNLNAELNKLKTNCSGFQYWLDSVPKDTSTKPTIKVPQIDLELQEQQAVLNVKIANLVKENEKINKNNATKRKLKNLVIPEKPKGEYQDTTPLVSEKGALNQEIRTLKSKVSEIEKTPDICPTCKQPINKQPLYQIVDKYKTDLNAALETQSSIDEKLKYIQETNAQITAHERALSQQELLEEQIDKTLEDIPKSKEEWEIELRKIIAKLKAQREERARIEQENQKAIEHNGYIKSTLQKKKSVEKEFAEAKKALKQKQELKTNIEIIKNAFGNKGILAYKIESCISGLQDLINEYLAVLSSNRFYLTLEAVDSKLPVKLLDNGHEISITALSSGELARVNCATLLGIRKLLDTISKSRINLLILDEVINVLDLEGRETLIEILNKENMNTFLVSHGYEHPFCEKLEISKKNGVSEIT